MRERVDYTNRAPASRNPEQRLHPRYLKLVSTPADFGFWLRFHCAPVLTYFICSAPVLAKASSPHSRALSATRIQAQLQHPGVRSRDGRELGVPQQSGVGEALVRVFRERSQNAKLDGRACSSVRGMAAAQRALQRSIEDCRVREGASCGDVPRPWPASEPAFTCFRNRCSARFRISVPVSSEYARRCGRGGPEALRSGFALRTTRINLTRGCTNCVLRAYCGGEDGGTPYFFHLPVHDRYLGMWRT